MNDTSPLNGQTSKWFPEFQWHSFLREGPKISGTNWKMKQADIFYYVSHKDNTMSNVRIHAHTHYPRKYQQLTIQISKTV